MSEEIKTIKDEFSNSADEDEEDLFKADDDDEDKAVVKENPADEPEKATEPSSSSAPSEIPPKEEKLPPMDKPIPRVSAPAPSPAPAPAPAPSTPVVKPGSNANKYGLPEDIKIPSSVTPSILNGKLLDSIKGLPNNLINDALAEYDDAVQIKGDSIRNHGAYLWGVVKRYTSVQERAASGEGQAILPMGPDLTPAVNDRLARLVADRFCSEEEMNDKVKSKIRMLSETDALFAIEELASVDRTQIRNFGSYFMGILNRYMRGERKDVTSGKRSLAQVRQQFQSPHGNRHDDRKRGRDTEPAYRHARNDQGQRDHYGGGPRRDSRDFYGSNQHQNNRPPMMSPPPPPPRMGGPNQYQHQPPSYGQNSYGQQQGPPQHQPYAPPSSGHPNHYGSQPMQSQPGFGQPPQNQYGQSQNIVSQNPYGSVQQQSGGVPGLPPPSNSYGMPPQNQPPYMNQQQQPSYSNAPYSPPQAQQNRFSQPGAPPNQWGNQAPPHSPAPPMDILALADKASSAVQALQNQNKFSYQQPPPYQQRPPYGQQPPPMNPQISYPPGNQPYQAQPAHMGNNSGPAQKKRRTTATIVELPTNVQFAVQNLQATGQTGPLDEGMLGMVKDLPEDLALQSLQKFASLDKSTMRNPTAYLAGLLRRELEKINRR